MSATCKIRMCQQKSVDKRALIKHIKSHKNQTTERKIISLTLSKISSVHWVWKIKVKLIQSLTVTQSVPYTILLSFSYE